MGECSAWNKGNAWGVRAEQDEPIVSLVEIMSEELVNELNVTKDDATVARELESSEQVFDDDLALAQALQREFDREYDISIRLEESKLAGKNTVMMTPDRYCPHAQQDQEESSEDEEDEREQAAFQLYKQLTADDFSQTKSDNGDLVTKHDAAISGRKNADKCMNDGNLRLYCGDISGEQINSKIYNRLRRFCKTDMKRQHKLKDKEEKATMETSVDAVTRLALFKWINQGIFDRVEGIVATGKESAVLHALLGEDAVEGEQQHLVIKVYKTSLTEFKNRSEYVKDDFRFKNARCVMRVWAEKEYLNLKRMAKAKLPCPTPIKLKRHVLLMEMIGDRHGAAAPKLKNCEWTGPDMALDCFLQVQDIMVRMYKECQLVHGDLSEFNLLLQDGCVFVIDVSQSMDLSHPRALHYLIRDIHNVRVFFDRLATPMLPTACEMFNAITDLDMKEGDDLIVQVENFEKDNRNVQLRSDKRKPATMELRLYQAERKATRGPSPARDYN